MIRDFFKLLFLIALAYAGYQLWSGKPISNPFGGGGSAYSSSKVRELPGGERFEMSQHSAREGVTLFYFTARSSISCKLFGPQLTQYVTGTQGVALRRIDIGGNDSPVAKQHGIRSVPQVWIANPQGRVLSKVMQPEVAAVQAAVKATGLVRN